MRRRGAAAGRMRQRVIRLRFTQRLGAGLVAVVGAEQHVHRRHDEQREQGADGQAGGDDQAHVETADRARSAGENQRHDAQHHGGSGHQNRTQTHACGVFDGFAFTSPFTLQIVGELDDENAMLGDQADQRHQPDLGVDVEGGVADAQVDEQQRARDRHGHRHQNDDRIAEALELCRQRQENDDHGEAEGQHQPTCLLLELARRPGEVVAIADRQGALGEGHQIVQRLPLGDGGQGNALNGGRVELLEVVDGFGLHARGQVHHGGQRHHRPAGRADVVVLQLAGIEAVLLRDLRNDLVGAAVELEKVDVTAAEHGRHRRADVLHGQAELRGHIAVDVQAGLRQVDAQVRLQEDELAGFQRVLQEFLRHVIELVRRFGGGDDELDGQPARARQRRRLEHGDLAAGDVIELLL